MKTQFLILILAVGQFIGFLPSASAVTLNDIYQDFHSTRDWGAEEIGGKIRIFLASSPSPSDTLTCDLLLINYLMSGGKESSPNELQTLVSTIMQQNPNTWQAAMAAVTYAAILNNDADPQALTAAQNALTLVNAINFSTLTDQAWIQFRDGVGDTNSGPKDGALTVIAAVYIRLGAHQDAANAISQIIDPDVKAAMTKILNDPT